MSLCCCIERLSFTMKLCCPFNEAKTSSMCCFFLLLFSVVPICNSLCLHTSRQQSLLYVPVLTFLVLAFCLIVLFCFLMTPHLTIKYFKNSTFTAFLEYFHCERCKSSLVRRVIGVHCKRWGDFSDGNTETFTVNKILYSTNKNHWLGSGCHAGFWMEGMNY